MSSGRRKTSKADLGKSQACTPVTIQPAKLVGMVTETAGQEEAKPQYLTHEEAARWEQDLLNQVRSYIDRGRARTEKAIQELTLEVANFRRAGQNTTIPKPAFRAPPPE